MSIDGQTQLVGIIGWPVAHSLSPAMHNAAFSYTGLNWRYLPLPVHTENLAEAIKGLNALGFRGANITIPHKVDAIQFVDSITEAVTIVGAVNTVRIDRTTGRVEGMNTDMGGFLMDLAANKVKLGKTSRVIVLGAGGSARAVCAGLVRSGAIVTIVNRTLANAESLVRYVQSSWTPASIDLAPMDALAAISKGATLIVNTTSVGQWPDTESSPWPEHVPFPEGATVYDLVYRPLKTRLMRDAEAAGLKAVGGIGMLVYQGASAFEAWTGKKPPVDLMKMMCLQMLGEASNAPKIEQAD